MKLTIIAGEVSGDMHGANLVKALKEQVSDLQLSGIGGDLLLAEGQRQLYHARQMAFLGIGEIVRHLPFIRRVFHTLLEHIGREKPDAVILIDYPGFNLRLAKKLKRMGVPVIYYISPQLWAWGKRRVKIIRDCVDKMLVIFPFEVDFYRRHGIEATYVGHPIVDSLEGHVSPKANENGKRILGLMPGSRRHELDSLLPDMLAAADLLHDQGRVATVLVARVDNLPLEVYQRYIGTRGFVRVHFGDSASFYNQLDAALVKSGTSTLETAFFRVPFVIVYRVSYLTWYLGKMLVKLDNIGLANIVAGHKIAEELLQSEFTPETAADALTPLLQAENNRKRRKELAVVAEKLGGTGASQKAAGEIISFVNKKL